MENFRFRPATAKQPQLTKAAAESIAIEALTFLAGNPARLDRFLALSGLGWDTLRVAAGEPGFGRDRRSSRLRRVPAPRLRGHRRVRPGNDRQGAGHIVALAEMP